ncbi:hypothetical protein M758_5G088700 [Ceratodon purpureus]|nr:hypothetical protein M758_5G088700 [Ceratodon purpureus]
MRIRYPSVHLFSIHTNFHVTVLLCCHLPFHTSALWQCPLSIVVCHCRWDSENESWMICISESLLFSLVIVDYFHIQYSCCTVQSGDAYPRNNPKFLIVT